MEESLWRQYYAMFQSRLLSSSSSAKTLMDSLDDNWIQTMKGQGDLSDAQKNRNIYLRRAYLFHL